MAALVAFTGASVLRSREVYADVRASVWDGWDGALRRVLSQSVELEPRGWRAALALHPGRVARRLLLDDTRPMFQMRFWDGVATGMAATVAYASINSLIWWLALTMPQSVLVPTVSALVFAPLVAGIIGLGVWRGTFAYLAAGGQRPELVQLAGGLSLGLLAGQFLALDATITYDSNLVVLAAYKLAWILALGASLYVFLRWVSAGASAWLAYAANQRSPRPACLLGLGCSSAVLVLWLGLLFGADSLAVGSSATGGSFARFVLGAVGYATLYLTTLPVTLLVIVTLWAYPLGPLFTQRRRATTCASWVYLDTTPPITLPVRSGDSLRQAAVSGLLGGLACATAYAVAWWWRSTLPSDVRQADSTTIFFYFSLVGVGIAVQMIVAAGAAARARVSPAAQGLFAAFLAGGVATLGFVVAAEVAGNRLAVDFIWQLVTHVVGAGAVASLVAVLVVAACRGDVAPAITAWDGTPLRT
jgi:hypothetical protein